MKTPFIDIILNRIVKEFNAYHKINRHYDRHLIQQFLINNSKITLEVILYKFIVKDEIIFSATKKIILLFLRKYFIAFLNEHNIYSQFIYNVNQPTTTIAYGFRGNIDDYFQYLMYHEQNPSEMISSSFVWNNTQEGYNFWLQQHIKYQRYIIQILFGIKNE